MMDARQRRRRFVNLLIAANGVGFLLFGTALGGMVKGDTPFPWFGLAGVIVLFFAIAVPFYREFLALRDSFEDVERDALRTLRREDGRTREAEILGPRADRPEIHRARHQHAISIAISALAWALIGIECVLWAIRL